jgi:hypothetical protein
MTDTDLDARRIRAARNQSMFREVNERIVELSDRWASLPQFVCECESAQCAETLEATGDEYETVRSDPTCFLVAHGHNVPEVEDTVSENERFMIVRKLGKGQLIAIQYDPRAHESV